jgi:hypothetical protein
MAVTTSIFQGGLYHLLHAADMDLDSDTLKIALFNSYLVNGGGSPTPPTTVANLLAYANIASFGTYTLLAALKSAGVEVVGTGYTLAGASLSGVTVSMVPSTSAPDWTANTAYTVGQIVAKVSDNAHIYRCVVAGTSHGSTEPTWPTGAGITVTDNTITWAECGSCYAKLTFTAPTWPNSTMTARYAVIYDDTSSSKWNLILIDFGADVSTTNGTFTVTPDATYGIIQLPIL